MLRIVRKMNQLNFSDLMNVYSESNTENGELSYPFLSRESQIREAEQDFYQYLQEVFFHQKDAFYALWEVDNIYRAGLRIEPYRDGLLLCALETTPSERRKGYATALIRAVLDHLTSTDDIKVYSHISKKNTASISVHQKCDFVITLDHALYSDGSVLHSCYTLEYNKMSET